VAQDAGTRLRTEISNDAHLLVGAEHPTIAHVPASACVLKDTTLMLLQPLAGARAANLEAGIQGPARSLPWHGTCSYPSWKGANTNGGDSAEYLQHGTAFHTILAVAVADDVGTSSNVYTGSAAVGMHNAS
jgi:hypothetical protein